MANSAAHGVPRGRLTTKVLRAPSDLGGVRVAMPLEFTADSNWTPVQKVRRKSQIPVFGRLFGVRGIAVLHSVFRGGDSPRKVKTHPPTGAGAISKRLLIKAG